eukprot:5068279-Alexandrium_andersonii.AAC.1
MNTHAHAIHVCAWNARDCHHRSSAQRHRPLPSGPRRSPTLTRGLNLSKAVPAAARACRCAL